jgi:hypothetical protein
LSSLGDAIGRHRAGEVPGGGTDAGKSAPRPPAPLLAGASANGAPAGADQPRDDRSDLRRRRDALAEQVMELHWDLGGLAYEMAIRDHFRLDVLVRRAAILQERDAELAELERLLHLEDGGNAGSCPNCGAPHSRGAVFCWQCGSGLMALGDDAATAESPLAAPDADATAGDTNVMDALLATDGSVSGEPRSRASFGRE